MRVIEPDAFLSEAEVLKRWPMLSRTELRRARKANPPKIEFYDFRKKAGGPCYTAEQVQKYIDTTYLRVSPCPDTKSAAASPQSSPDSSLADITSTVPTTTGEGIGTLSAMTPALAKFAAEALRNEILSGPRSSSQRSSRSRQVHHAG